MREVFVVEKWRSSMPGYRRVVVMKGNNLKEHGGQVQEEGYT